ncbi:MULTISPECIES: methionine synthase [unclassified Nocardioides]|uniref:methionine synthase n=1 Tax=unclassified Nocardioides TaxID=2615069 RepID=UPI0000EB6371|nr:MULTISPECIES: methionine synthase [unclassified Nocardioides]ABL82944.1 Methionine synthase, vitamin-B12 independent [Nocardioides sp. JS614]
MTLATGVGSYPGVDQAAYDEAVRTVLGELGEGGTGLPHLPEVPGRGATATLTGRGLAVVAELTADLQPAGWRLTGTHGGSGVDHRRARSLLAQDLDTLEEEAAGLAGAFKIQVAGPWTLAATVEKPRGDKIVSDAGARRELAQALAEGLGDHVRDVRRRLPDVQRLVVQVDEPAIAAVLAGKVPTASGFGRHRSVHPPEAAEALEWVLGAVSAAGAEPWVHTCAPDAPVRLLTGAGARGLSVDLAVATAADHDAVAEALEAGGTVALGVVPASDPPTAPTDAGVTESVLRWLDMVGLDPAEVADRLVVTAGCGFAGATPTWVRRALGLLRTSAASLSG